MSIAYRIHKESGFTLVHWDGVVAAADFLAHVQRLSSDADWPPFRRLHISDLRNTSLDASMDHAALEAAAEIYGRHSDKLANLKVAVVADEAFWKAVDFERLISRYGASVTVFNFLDTACKWLGLDADEVGRAVQQLRASRDAGSITESTTGNTP